MMLVNPYIFQAGTPGVGYKVDVSVPAASVTASLSGFPVFIDLADMPSGFWAHTKRDGGDIRVNVGGTSIPFDLVRFSRNGRKGGLFAKTSLSSASSTVITITYGNSSLSKLAVTDANGRNAVWSAYERVFAFSLDLVDRTGKGVDLTMTSTQPNQAVVLNTSPNTNSHQGVEWDGTHYYTTDTNAIYKWDSSWNLVATNASPVSSIPGTNHCGDPCVKDGYLYIPIENYSSSTVWSVQNLARFLISDLSFVDTVNISAQNHECSTICWVPELDCFVVGSYAHSTTVFKYAADRSYLGTITLDTAIDKIQGITSMDGLLFINGETGNRMFMAKLDGAVVMQVAVVTGGTFEGISHKDGNLLVLNDGGVGSRYVREVQPGWLAASGGANFGGTSAYVGAGAANFTTWTIGASVRLATKTGTNRGIATYGNATDGTDTIRASLLYRLSSDRFGFWNSTDAFLLDTISPVVNTHYRLHGYHNGTSGRGLYRDGTLVASAGSSAARPSALGNAVHVGREDPTGSEWMNGDVGFVYLINAVLSAAWIAAEVLNIKSPSGFYSVGSESAA